MGERACWCVGCVDEMMGMDRINGEDELMNHMNGVDEMLDYPRALYAAYLCGCIKNEIDEQLTEEEFYELLPFDMGEVVNTYLELYNSGKKKPSGNPSA